MSTQGAKAAAIDALRLYAVLDGDRLATLWAEIDRLTADLQNCHAMLRATGRAKLRAERDQLARFVNWIVEEHPESYPDGFAIQDEAERVGIFIDAKPKEPCGEGCQCAEYHSADEWDAGEVKCLRLAEWIKDAGRAE